MDSKDQVKQALSIVDVASNYIRLEKSGNQYKARCPFHNEKTASFYISPERGTYHCFGCSEHGDIFSFVEKMENISFYEALTILAERAGIKLTTYKKDNQKKELNLIKILEVATKHFENNLKKTATAKLYLQERGLIGKTIQEFNIGFALGGDNGWRDLFTALTEEGFTPEEMVRAGVVVKKTDEEKYFDRFRGRIMFPIKNSLGKTVGFSARILPEYDTGKFGKYINSPESEIYHKGKILFAYDLAKKSIAEKKEVILVEGQMDAIMSHQAGVTNVVATSGTAVTEEQLKILKRFANKILLSFDADRAGQKASERGSTLSLLNNNNEKVTNDLDVYIIPKEKGIKDAADLIKEKGGKAWLDLIAQGKPLIVYFTDFIIKNTLDTRDRHKKIKMEVLPYLRKIKSAIDRAYFIKYIAQKLNISEDDIRDDLKDVKLEENFNETSPRGNLKENKLKINRVKEILAILAWQKMSTDAYLKFFFTDKDKSVDYETNFLIDSKDIPAEILEREIILQETQISMNSDYLENPEKFIEEELFVRTKHYKLEILSKKQMKLKELDKHDQEFIQQVNDVAQEKRRLENQLWIK